MGVTVSEVQAKIQKGSLVVTAWHMWLKMSRQVPRFARVCNELQDGQELVLWHGQLHHHGVEGTKHESEPSQGVSTDTGDSAKKKEEARL